MSQADLLSTSRVFFSPSTGIVPSSVPERLKMAMVPSCTPGILIYGHNLPYNFLLLSLDMLSTPMFWYGLGFWLCLCMVMQGWSIPECDMLPCGAVLFGTRKPASRRLACLRVQNYLHWEPANRKCIDANELHRSQMNSLKTWFLQNEHKSRDDLTHFLFKRRLQGSTLQRWRSFHHTSHHCHDRHFKFQFVHCFRSSISYSEFWWCSPY